MRRYLALVLALACMALGACGQTEEEDLRQGDGAAQYFFSGEITAAETGYLRIRVNDIGNSGLSYGDSVEVSTDTVYGDGGREFAAGEYARVLLASNTEDPAARLEALSVYKIDETGAILTG